MTVRVPGWLYESLREQSNITKRPFSAAVRRVLESGDKAERASWSPAERAGRRPEKRRKKRPVDYGAVVRDAVARRDTVGLEQALFEVLLDRGDVVSADDRRLASAVISTVVFFLKPLLLPKQPDASLDVEIRL